MRKINLLLLAAFVTGLLTAGTHTEKTYLQTRPFLSNMPMEYSTWHTQVNKKVIGPWDASVQATGFFQRSENESNLGEYFGYYATNAQELRRYIPVQITGDNDSIPGRNLFHSNAGANNVSGKTQLNPKQKSIGLRLDYYQNIKDFFLKVSTPITHVESGLYFKSIGNLVAATTGAGTGQTIKNFFEGNVEQTTGADQQAKLQYAKIGNNESRTGLGDIELAGGYNIYKEKGHHFKAGVNLTIPTSNKAKAEWLFEPITGNGGYWELGVFSDAKFVLWKKGKGRIEFFSAGKLEYLFRETEKRTIGLKNYITAGSDSDPLAHYYLAGETGQNALFPAANVLTQDVKIEPQLNFELLASTILISDNFTFEFGYNLFYKEKETIKLRNDWVNNKYALSAITFDSTGVFDPLVGGDSLGDVGPINSTHLNYEAAQSPSALTNKIYCAMGYAFNDWKRPWMLGIGGAYEFHAGNTALEGFEIWLKSALSF